MEEANQNLIFILRQCLKNKNAGGYNRFLRSLTRKRNGRQQLIKATIYLWTNQPLKSLNQAEADFPLTSRDCLENNDPVR